MTEPTSCVALMGAAAGGVSAMERLSCQGWPKFPPQSLGDSWRSSIEPGIPHHPLLSTEICRFCDKAATGPDASWPGTHLSYLSCESQHWLRKGGCGSTWCNTRMGQRCESWSKMVQGFQKFSEPAQSCPADYADFDTNPNPKE